MTYAPDLIIEALQDGLHRIAAIRKSGDGWRVVTHCMYPSNGLVEVTVRGGSHTVVASDEGGAVGDALSAGIPERDYDGALRHLVRDQGLLLKDGVIYTPQVPMDAAPLSVLLVANASQDVARWLYDHMRTKRTRDFKALLAEFLRHQFDTQVEHNALIQGHSTKAHKFANVISFAGGKRLIVDPVGNEASSINARVVANLDVRARNDPMLEQRIVYDDDDEWTPSDLNLLQVGATVVPFSRAQEVIDRIIARA